jgi:hypothetical protein
MRRRKHITLGHKLTRTQFAVANSVLAANGVAAVAKEGRALPNVATLLTRLNGLELGRAVRVLGELVGALDGGEGDAEHAS